MKIHSAANLVDLSSEWPDTPDNQERHRRAASRNRPKSNSQRAESVFHDNDGEREEHEESDCASSGDIKFCSRSEAICAELLKRYVPHFELRHGLTFQVPIGRDTRGNLLAVDFLVDGVLFEYHPVRLFKNRRRYGDFNNKQEYRAYTDAFHSIRRDQREFFLEAVRARLTKNYYGRRRALLDQHPTYRRMELVVATSPEEFYHLILKRFGKNAPRTVERFMAIFEELRVALPG